MRKALLTLAVAVPSLLASAAQAASPSPPPGPARDGPVLERVVAIARHGVRSPTQSPEALAAITGRPWPIWPVAPGELTDHGAQALARMGGYLREVYTREGLLPRQACPAADAVQVWADGHDQRTRRSGQVLADALAPACGVTARHGPETEIDPVFEAANTGVCPVDPDQALAALKARTDDGGAIVRPTEAKALAALQAIVAPDGCRATAGFCLLGETGFASGKKGVKLTGPLGIGPSLAEDLLLEYVQGLPKSQVGWGAAGDATAIAGVMPVHERSADLLRQTPYLALHNGAVMAMTVLDLLQGQAPSSRHAPSLSPTARLVVLAGHDTNLSNMAGTFDLAWTLPNQPDVTAPDTVLAFELWRDHGVKTVRAVVYSQSLEQLRSARRLDSNHPAGVTPVAIPGCADAPGVCRLQTLVKLVTQRLPADCLH